MSWAVFWLVSCMVVRCLIRVQIRVQIRGQIRGQVRGVDQFGDRATGCFAGLSVFPAKLSDLKRRHASSRCCILNRHSKPNPNKSSLLIRVVNRGDDTHYFAVHRHQGPT